MEDSDDCTYNTSGKKRNYAKKETDYKVKGENNQDSSCTSTKTTTKSPKELELMSFQRQRNTNLW